MRHLCLTILCVALAAEEPTISLQVTDPGRVLDRLEASIYGRAWAHPQARPLATRIRAELAPMAAQLGQEDVATVIRALDGLRLDITSNDGDFDHVDAQAFVFSEPLAEQLFAMLAGDGEAIELPEGATAAKQAGLQRIARYADGVGVGIDGGEVGRLALESSPFDCFATFDWSAQGRALERRGVAADVVADLLALAPRGWGLAVLEEGLKQWIVFDRRPPGLTTVDRAMLERVPAEVGMVLAVGVDGAAWWAQLDRLLDGMEADATGSRDVAALREELARGLTSLGLDPDPAVLAAGVSGTTLTMLGSGVGLVPSLSVVLPRSPEVDSVVAAIYDLTDSALPPEGGYGFLVLPAALDGADRVAPGLVVGRDAATWILSTDGLLVERWVAGETGGWLAAHEAAYDPELLATAEVVGWADTRSLLRMALPLMGLATGEVREPRLTEAILAYGLALVRASGDDVLIGASDEDGAWGLEGRGPLGGLGLLMTPNLSTAAVVALVVVPQFGVARSEARRAASSNHLKQLVMACIVHSTDHDQQWPASLDRLVEAGELPEALLTSPSGEGVEPPHYLYVRPHPAAKSMQPVILEHPACNGGDALLAVFADGHTEVIEGPMVERVWAKALELAESEHAQGDGVRHTHWGEVYTELNR